MAHLFHGLQLLPQPLSLLLALLPSHSPHLSLPLSQQSQPVLKHSTENQFFICPLFLQLSLQI